MLYEGAEVVLTPEQEEVASMWALMPESYQQQPTFAKNFFRDFKALFPKDSHIKELAKVQMTGQQTRGSSASACALGISASVSALDCATVCFVRFVSHPSLPA
jgi:hypothetical protein